MMYCENKIKPKMHCNGKCHLMKKMKQEEKRENAPVNNTLKDKYESQVQPVVFSMKLLPDLKPILHNSSYRIHQSVSHLFPVFHPPTC